jgi:hypothetical protein
MHSRTRYVGKILAKINHLEDLGVDGRIILELIFKKCNWGRGLDWAGSEFGQMAGSCEFGNKHSGSMKCGEFLSLDEDLLASQEELRSLELVS